MSTRVPVRRQPGRPRTIGGDVIADAALMLCRGGIEAVTVQSVADELGVQRSAIYHHVAGRAGLLRALGDRFVAVVEWPVATGDWRDYLTGIVGALNAACTRYPGAAEVIYNTLWPLPAGLIRSAAACIEDLCALGFPRPLAVTSADMVFNFAVDECIRINRIRRVSAAGGRFTGDAADSLSGLTVAAMEAHYDAGPAFWVQSKLDILLDGIRMRLASSGSAAG